MRTATIERKTKETQITLTIELDGTGKVEVNTGVGFFDHMLTALATHAGFDLKLTCKGDLQVDSHHTVEDVGIVLGCAILKALGNKNNITRYGTAFIPMDEALGFVSLDISARPFLVFDAQFRGDNIGDMGSDMVLEFFRAFGFNAGITLHVKKLNGINDHHIAEALFKALAYALKKAVALKSDGTVSTKGVI